MTIQDWGVVGEVVGAIGVIVTLVYLAYQIRQNTSQLEQNTMSAKAAAQTHATGFSPETWETQGRTLVTQILATPGGEWFWAKFGDNYPKGFRDEVREILSGA